MRRIVSVVSMLILILVLYKVDHDRTWLSPKWLSSISWLVIWKHNADNDTEDSATGARRQCAKYHQYSHTRTSPVDILGLEVDQLTEKLIEPLTPLSFLPDYKNPCWIEYLPEDYLDEYRRTIYSRHGKRHVTNLQPIFDQRLDSGQPGNAWRMKCLPYVFLAGVTKSGTTDLYDTLRIHPDVHVPWVKEPMYWHRHRYQRGVHYHDGKIGAHFSFANYTTEFDYAANLINASYVETPCGKRHHGITIDGSSYLFWEDNGWSEEPGNQGLIEPRVTTINALHTALPQAKIIVLLRNPTKRVHSAFNMYANDRYLHFPGGKSAFHFDGYTATGIRLYEECFRQHGVRACAYNTTLSSALHPLSLRPSLYSVYLKDWWKAFDKEQILIIKSEDYYMDRLKAFDTIRKFLDLSSISDELKGTILKKKTSMKRRYSRMLPNTEQMLDEFFAPFNKELESMLGTSLWS